MTSDSWSTASGSGGDLSPRLGDEFSAGPAYSPARRRTGCGGCLLVGCGCLVAVVLTIVVAGTVITVFFGHRFQQWIASLVQEPYEMGVQRVQGSARVAERLGIPVTCGQPEGVQYKKFAGGPATVSMQFDIVGSQGKAKAALEGATEGGKWKLQRLWVTYEDGTGEDLLRTEPEPKLDEQKRDAEASPAAKDNPM